MTICPLTSQRSVVGGESFDDSGGSELQNGCVCAVVLGGDQFEFELLPLDCVDVDGPRCQLGPVG